MRSLRHAGGGEMGFVSDYEFEFDRPRVHEFIAHMVEFTGASDN